MKAVQFLLMTMIVSQTGVTAFQQRGRRDVSSSLSSVNEHHKRESSDKDCSAVATPGKFSSFSLPPPPLPSSSPFALTMPRPCSTVWSHLAPDLLRNLERRGNVQVKLQWKPSDNNLLSVAQAAVREATPWFAADGQQNAATGPRRLLMERDVHQTVAEFTHFCRTHFNATPNDSRSIIKGYKLKLAAARGPDATHCPMWHTDYVPVRCLQTLHGPGTLYIDTCHDTSQNVYWQRIMAGDKTVEEADGNVDPEWKARLLEKSGLTPQQARTGQALLFVGNAWPRHMPNKPFPVLHKSPRGVPGNQARLLLSLDVILQSEGENKEQDNVCSKGCCSKP